MSEHAAYSGHPVTANTRGPAISVFAWFWAIASLYCVILKVSYKIYRIRKLMVDDFLLILALTCCFVFAGRIDICVRDGIGMRLKLLDVQHVVKADQDLYIANLVFIPVLSLSKLSTVRFAGSMSPQPRMHHMVRYTTIVMILWTILSVTGLALYCARGLKLGDRSDGRCGDVRAVWLPIEFINMLLEIWTAVFPIILMKDRQTTAHRRYILCVMFGIRLLILPLLVARLIFLSQITNSPDWTYDIYPAITTMILEANATVCFSCFPFIKVLVDTFRQRMMFGFNHDYTELKQHTDTDSTGETAFGDMKMGVVDMIIAIPDLEGASEGERTLTSQTFESSFYSKHSKFAPVTTVAAHWLPMYRGVDASDLHDNEIVMQTDVLVFSEPWSES